MVTLICTTAWTDETTGRRFAAGSTLVFSKRRADELLRTNPGLFSRTNYDDGRVDRMFHSQGLRRGG